MEIKLDSVICKNAETFMKLLGKYYPFEYHGTKNETLAARETAWLGVCLNMTPIYDVSGPDAAIFMNSICVNRNFSKMQPGDSKHALVCNDKGHMIADGVAMYKGDGVYRTYWLAPVLQYYLDKSGLDVHGEYRDDEYFFQIDGPKSLEILEKACQADLHDIKFAKNKTVKICGTDITVHRLGMSGALAYEVHGDEKDAEVAYGRILEVLEEFGGKQQGIKNYTMVNHTPAGYTNQNMHFVYAYLEEPDLAEFMKTAFGLPQIASGSASAVTSDCYVTPYDIGWGYLVNFDHEFKGKEALREVKVTQPKKAVSLVWNPEDLGRVFASQFMGPDVEPYDRVDTYLQGNMEIGVPYSIRCDYVLADGKKIGYAAGKTNYFYEQRMISLAFIDKEYAEIGRELKVLWGDVGHPQTEIRVTVAPFPYYNGEYRNETFDTEKIPHPKFD